MVSSKKGPKLRINTTVTGDPARWLLEWKHRGLVTSVTDAVNQAIQVLHEVITERDLKDAKMGNLQGTDY